MVTKHEDFDVTVNKYAVALVHFFRLCVMCAWTSVLAAKAAKRDNSPAIVAAATTVANFLAFSPGVLPPPLHPIACKQAACASRLVPPPTVPTSKLGIVQEIHKSPSDVSSNSVIAS